ESVPIFYWPYIQGDANDPLGPLQNFSFGQDQIFGTQVYLTFNMWNLLRIVPVPQTRWTLLTDYFSDRGPSLGSNVDYMGNQRFGIPNTYQGNVKTYGIYDQGTDNLGGGRGENDNHPLWRGRFLWRENMAQL